MVLYYGLLALETANKTIATASASTLVSDRPSPSHNRQNHTNSLRRAPLSSSTNSWIYTEDLKRRFEERYADYRYVLVPVYVDRASSDHSRSTTAIPTRKGDDDNSWMYSRSLRDYLCHSTSKMSLPLVTNKSSSVCCVTNRGFMADEMPTKRDLRTRLFKRTSSAREHSTTHSSSSSLPFSPLASSSPAFAAAANNAVRHRASAVVEEEDDDDEGVDNENHSVPLIKHE